MKVYFEHTGGRSGVSHFISVYIKPTKDGYGYRYAGNGTLFQFAWVHTKCALVIDHKQMSKEQWYAFKYGEYKWELDIKYDVTIENILKYAKIPNRTIQQVKTEQKLKKTTLQTEQDIIKILPLLKKCKYIPQNIVNKIFKIAKINNTPIMNGELGVARMQDSIKLSIYLHHLCKKYDLSDLKITKYGD